MHSGAVVITWSLFIFSSFCHATSFPLGYLQVHTYLVNCKLQNTLFYGQSEIEIASHCQTEIVERVLQSILKGKAIQASDQTKTSTTRIILSG